MALVEVARFLDLTEAQVLTSALRSSCMFVFLQNEIIGQMYFNRTYAMGEFRIWVPEGDEDDARALIGESRRMPSTLAPLPLAEATVRAAASFLLTLLTGVVTTLRPRRPERLADGA